MSINLDDKMKHQQVQEVKLYASFGSMAIVWAQSVLLIKTSQLQTIYEVFPHCNRSRSRKLVYMDP